MTVGAPTVWARALHRAECHNIEVSLASTQQDGFNVTEFWKATSASCPGIVHGIRIESTPEGVRSSCTCEAGMRGSVCLHQAKAMREAGLLPDLMLIESVEEAKEELRIEVVDPMTEVRKRAIALLMGQQPVA